MINEHNVIHILRNEWKLACWNKSFSYAKKSSKFYRLIDGKYKRVIDMKKALGMVHVLYENMLEEGYFDPFGSK